MREDDNRVTAGDLDPGSDIYVTRMRFSRAHLSPDCRAIVHDENPREKAAGVVFDDYEICMNCAEEELGVEANKPQRYGSTGMIEALLEADPDDVSGVAMTADGRRVDDLPIGPPKS